MPPMRPASAASGCRRRTRVTRSVSRSLFSRPASRWRSTTLRCSVTQSLIRGWNDRDGRRNASRRSSGANPSAPARPAAASRSQASTLRTAVRSANSRPTPPAIGTPADAERDLDRRQRGVDPREDGDIGRRGTAGDRPLHRARGSPRPGRRHRRPTIRPDRSTRRGSSWPPDGGCGAAVGRPPRPNRPGTGS